MGMTFEKLRSKIKELLTTNMSHVTQSEVDEGVYVAKEMAYGGPLPTDGGFSYSSMFANGFKQLPPSGQKIVVDGEFSDTTLLYSRRHPIFKLGIDITEVPKLIDLYDSLVRDMYGYYEVEWNDRGHHEGEMMDEADRQIERMITPIVRQYKQLNGHLSPTTRTKNRNKPKS